MWIKIAIGFIISLSSISTAVASREIDNKNIFKATSYLDVNVTSYHFNQLRNFNSANIGLGFENIVSNDYRYLIGIYRNSFYKESVYALMGYTPFKYSLGDVQNDIGVVGGVVSGYKQQTGMDLTPMAAFFMSSEYKNFGVNITVIPTMRALHTTGFAGFQLKYKLRD